MKATALLLVLLQWTPCVALAKPTIVWLNSHWPPFRMAEEPEKGQGHLDQMLTLLIAELPQYSHQVLYSNLARVEHALATPGGPACIFSVLYNETRATTMRFSIPAVLSVNVMLHMRAHHPLVPQWQVSQSVDLAKITMDPAIRGMVERKRGYPALVQQYQDIATSNLTSQSLEKVNPIDLLGSNRFDYLIEFPDRVRYFQSLSAQKRPLIDLPIRGLEPLMYSYIGCQMGDQGEMRLRDINVALQPLRATAVYQKLMMQWLSPHRQLQLQQALPQFVDDVSLPTR